MNKLILLKSYAKIQVKNNYHFNIIIYAHNKNPLKTDTRQVNMRNKDYYFLLLPNEFG